MVQGGEKITVLYVDQAVAFGGAVVVIGCLVEAIDKSHFRPIVVGEMDASILQNHINGHAELFVIPRLFNYALWAKTVKSITRFPGSLPRKLAIYTLSAVRGLANMVYGLRLAKLILREGVVIVHVNNGMSNLAPVIVAILLRRRCIVHFHGMEKPGLFQRLFIQKVSRFIAVSEYLKKSLVENHIPENRIDIIHNPVRFKAVRPGTRDRVRDQYGIEPGQHVFGIVGRIVRWKGHVEFLKAADIVFKSVPEAKGLIIGDFSDGDSSYQSSITRMIKESEYSEKIIMTGYVENVEDLYSIMDVCVHASIDPEPFGLVITEAMAHGVPVIASDRGAPREIINDGVDGFLVDPVASDQLASAIIALLSDETLRQRIGNRGRERIQKDFRASTYWHAIENVYIEVMGGNQSPSDAPERQKL
ncbi:MAG: glycosyltransferase family 4 protein [Gammaproteobacteria bacterium]